MTRVQSMEAPREEGSSLLNSGKTILTATALLAITSAIGCVSTATGSSVSVVTDGNGDVVEVKCEPGHANGPNARGGRASVVINGKEMCPENK